ncbi:MAG TPA: hypothetical protein VID48_09420 [Solirubrobacteraceae bacterium]
MEHLINRPREITSAEQVLSLKVRARALGNGVGIVLCVCRPLAIDREFSTFLSRGC